MQFYALMFTYVIVFTFTTFWYLKDLHWISWVSLGIGLFIFLVFAIILIILFSLQIRLKIKKKNKKIETKDFIFPHI